MTETLRESAEEPPLADIAERLFAQFGARIPLSVIISAVREARADLSGTPKTALPELVERLAQYRISQASAAFDHERR